MEKKFIDFQVGTWLVPISFGDASWTVLKGTTSDGSFLGIQQGIKENERVGRKVVVTDLSWYITLRLPSISISTTPIEDLVWDNVRIILYIDTQTNGTAALGTAIMETLSAQAIFEFRNIENSRRFKILHDKVYQLRANVVASYCANNARVECGVVFDG